jgi:hypothetical protein
MRTWGPAVLIAVALGVLFVWSQCDRGPEKSYGSVTQEELIVIAAGVFGELEEDWEWSAVEQASFDIGVLSAAAQSQVNKVGDAEFSPPAGFLEEVEKAINDHKPGVYRDGGLHDWTLAHLVAARACLVKGDEKSAGTHLDVVAQATSRAVDSASSIDEWQQAQIARLRFLDLVPVILIELHNGEYPAIGSLILPSRFEGHRFSLGRIVQRRFFESVVPKIAEASASADLPQCVVDALFPSPEGDKRDLVAAMLRGHPRTFGPELTTTAGAESIKQLRAALAGPWPRSRGVIDSATKAQAFWKEFIGLLELSEAEAVERVKELKAEVDKLENPVGLALLHNERTSWPGLVQSAYVADARETAFLVLVQRMLGGALQQTDPISGGPLEVVGGAVRFKSDGKDHAYPFIEAFTSGPVRLGP